MIMDQEHSDGVSRRDLLAAGALAASGAMLASSSDALAAQPAAGGQVVDRGSAIRITALRALPAATKAYVKIETNANVTGWGEITGLEPRVACSLAESLRELLVDENPTRVEHLWQKVFRAHRDMRGGPFMVHTLSAIDMALWDIAGKLWGAPVYRLLGGPDGAVMFDAHCALPPPMLIQFAAAIEPYDVLWIEEPAVPGNIEVFKKLRQVIKVPLATGERDRTI